jgi:hypothetical protein
MREVPSAMAASMMARCDTDLSPGTSSAPDNAPRGDAIQSSRRHRLHAVKPFVSAPRASAGSRRDRPP